MRKKLRVRVATGEGQLPPLTQLPIRPQQIPMEAIVWDKNEFANSLAEDDPSFCDQFTLASDPKKARILIDKCIEYLRDPTFCSNNVTIENVKDIAPKACVLEDEFAQAYVDYLAESDPSFCNKFSTMDNTTKVLNLASSCAIDYPANLKYCTRVFDSEAKIETLQPKACITKQPSEKSRELYELFQPKAELLDLQGVPEERYVLNFIREQYGDRFPDPVSKPDAFAKVCKKACKKADESSFYDLPFKVTCGDRWEEFTWCSDPKNLQKLKDTLIGDIPEFPDTAIALCDPKSWRSDNCEFNE